MVKFLRLKDDLIVAVLRRKVLTNPEHLKLKKVGTVKGTNSFKNLRIL